MNIASTDYVDSKASGEFKSDRWLCQIVPLTDNDYCLMSFDWFTDINGAYISSTEVLTGSQNIGRLAKITFNVERSQLDAFKILNEVCEYNSGGMVDVMPKDTWGDATGAVVHVLYPFD